MLEMRPGCECCDTDLPPGSTDAVICSFECTFCRRCADTTLAVKCPNCGGAFTVRPTRADALLENYPAATKRALQPDGCR